MFTFQVEILCEIGGRSGQEDGTKIGYKAIDFFFSPNLLTKYSWTGLSRGKDGEKKSFRNLEGILDVFFQAISKADCRHTKQKNCNLFKEGVLKHAKKRSQRKRCSQNLETEALLEEEKAITLEDIDNEEVTEQEQLFEDVVQDEVE